LSRIYTAILISISGIDTYYLNAYLGVKEQTQMIRPIRDAILVKKDEVEMSKGGIIIPKTVGKDDTFFEGTIVAVGDGILTDSGKIAPLKVIAGDKVMFGNSGCADVKIDGKPFVIMREGNILGIID